MPRCKCCDYCDTTGEMSPYKWGLSIPNYSGQFILDPYSGDSYCLACWIDVFEYEIDMENNDEPMDEMGGIEMEVLEPGDAGCDEETDSEGGS